MHLTTSVSLCLCVYMVMSHTIVAMNGFATPARSSILSGSQQSEVLAEWLKRIRPMVDTATATRLYQDLLTQLRYRMKLFSATTNAPVSANQTTVSATHNVQNENRTSWKSDNQSHPTEPCPRHCICTKTTLFDKNAQLFYSMIKGLDKNRLPVDFDNWLTAARSTYMETIPTLFTTFDIAMSCQIGNGHLVVDEDFALQLGIDNKPAIINAEFICSPGGILIWLFHKLFSRFSSIHIKNCNMSSVKFITSRLETGPLFTSLNLDGVDPNFVNSITIGKHPYAFGKSIRLANMNVNRFSELLLQKIENLTLENVGRTPNCADLYNMGSFNGLTITDSDLTAYLPCFLTASTYYLNLSSNSISDISLLEYPNYVPPVRHLRLDLCNNRLNSLKRFAIMGVGQLHLCHNQIRGIDKRTFDYLKQLDIIDLSWNQIDHIESGVFKNLKHLSQLILHHNQIAVFETVHSPHPVTFIELQFNLMSYPSFFKSNFTTHGIYSVKADNNPYICDCNITQFVEFIFSPYREAYNIDHFDYLMRIEYEYMKKHENFPLIKIFKSPELLQCGYPSFLVGTPLLNVTFQESQQCPIVEDCDEPCDCWYNRDIQKVSVNCSGRHLNHLPQRLPLFNLITDFSNNNISQLTMGDYFNRIDKINLQNNAIVNVSPAAIVALLLASNVDLSFNHITTLPSTIIKIKPDPSSNISLGRNPRTCSCDTLWFTSWLHDNKHIIMNRSLMECERVTRAGEKVKVWELNDDLLDCSFVSFLALALSLGILCAILLISSPLVYIYRSEIKVLLYNYFNVRPFDKQPNLELYNAREFDVFISYSSADEDWLNNILLPRLENKDHSKMLKVLLHHRHFIPGESISENIFMAVSRSKCTLIVVSRNFAESLWCLYEFQQAHHEMIQDPCCNVVAVILDDISENVLPQDLKTFLKKNMCIHTCDQLFWQRLMYLLPKPSGE